VHQVHRNGCETKLGLLAPDLQELILWADLIDGAVFPSAQAAVRVKEPAMRLCWRSNDAGSAAAAQDYRVDAAHTAGSGYHRT